METYGKKQDHLSPRKVKVHTHTLFLFCDQFYKVKVHILLHTEEALLGDAKISCTGSKHTTNKGYIRRSRHQKFSPKSILKQQFC